MLNWETPTTCQEIYQYLDITEREAEPLMRDAKVPPDRQELPVSEMTRLNAALERMCTKLAGRDWRRADGADRQQYGAAEIGPYDLFHRKTGERQTFGTFGQLLRWSEAEYGWKV